MKKLSVLLSALLLTACNTTPVVKEETSAAQSVDESMFLLNAHVEKANMNRTFCDGRGFSYYSENKYNYTFRCKSVVDENGNYKEGGYFHLVK